MRCRKGCDELERYCLSDLAGTEPWRAWGEVIIIAAATQVLPLAQCGDLFTEGVPKAHPFL